MEKLSEINTFEFEYRRYLPHFDHIKVFKCLECFSDTFWTPVVFKGYTGGGGGGASNIPPKANKSRGF